MTGYKTHLFICTNNPTTAGKCGHKNSEELRRQLKERCQADFGNSVRVNASGCLGQCKDGIAAVLYPQNKWFLHLTDKDQEILYGEIKKIISETHS